MISAHILPQGPLENMEQRANQLYYWLKATRNDPTVSRQEFKSVAKQYRMVMDLIVTEVARCES